MANGLLSHKEDVLPIIFHLTSPYERHKDGHCSQSPHSCGDNIQLFPEQVCSLNFSQILRSLSKFKQGLVSQLVTATGLIYDKLLYFITAETCPFLEMFPVSTACIKVTGLEISGVLQ